MKRLDLAVHGILALAWFCCALGIGIKVALLGNQAATAGKQRGADFKARTEMVYQQDRQRAAFEQEACAPAIDQLVRNLELPLQPRVVTAAVNHYP